MTARLNGSETTLDAITKIADGNPGALAALVAVGSDLDLDMTTKLQVIYTLDAMNMHGAQIHVAFADWARNKVDVFVSGIQQRNAGMIDKVNAECGYTGELASSDL